MIFKRVLRSGMLEKEVRERQKVRVQLVEERRVNSYVSAIVKGS